MKRFKVALIETWTHYRWGYVHNERDAISKTVNADNEAAAIIAAKKLIKKENGYKERDFHTYYPERGGEYMEIKFRVEELPAA